MTLPAGSNNPPISLSDINGEFGLGNNLNAYRGARWYKDNNSRGFFPAGAISVSDFYSTRINSPVVSGSATLDRANWNGRNYTLPMFNNLNVTAYSGQGGKAGTSGNCQAGGSGGLGGASAFGSYAVTGTGAGGAPSAGDGSVVTASASWAITDGNQASILALYGASVAITAGAGGGAGATGYNTRAVTTCIQYAYYYGVPVCTLSVTNYYCDSAAGGGADGNNGYISVSWT